MGKSNAAMIEKMAAKGVAAGGGPLPHLERIQKSFGHHDISGVTASVGGSGGGTASDMGAAAYATGDSIVFARTPDLHLAAHEAAHVVQQLSGATSATAQHEAQADQVADLVASGKSAVAVLDQMVGKAGPVKQKATGNLIQMRWDDPQTKKVNAGAMKRIEKAKEAIAHTKSVVSFGAGNQYEALKASNFNSYYRMKAMRDVECWEMDPSVRQLANKHPNALTAAMGDLAGGGNCGEHAQIGYDYLCATTPGETISQCDKEGLDHAFVIMGDIKTEADNSLTVCDPWPTAATACLWEDHFAFVADKTKLNVRMSERASGDNVKAVIARGLKLSAKGLAMIKQKMSDEDTEKQLKDGTSRENGAHPWIWRHGPTASTEYDYQSEP
ncbi:MAG: DUF4157 domain-containing protein [Myxococcales bacterium]|nr:DUF4157 domain-containing protein [Myxococcales bacterium]